MRCQVWYYNTNYSRFGITSPRTNKTLWVNQGWVTNETNVFTKISRAVNNAMGTQVNHPVVNIDITREELQHFKRRADKMNYDKSHNRV